jgi:hypothetical protein
MVAYFEDVRRRQPDSALGQFGLARAWWILGERERARGELDALRRLNPDLARRAEAGLEPS